MADHGKRTSRRLLRVEGAPSATATRRKPSRFLRLPDRQRISRLRLGPMRILSPGEVPTSPVVRHNHPQVVAERKAIWRARMQSTTQRTDELIDLFRLLHLPEQATPTCLPEVHLLRCARSSTTTPRLTR